MFREVAITWQGRRVTFVPDFALVSQIERDPEAGSLIGMLADALAQRPRVSALAATLHLCLIRAGFEVTREDLLRSFFGSRASEMQALAQAVLIGIIPQDDGKNPAAPAKPKKARRGR